MKIVLCIAAVLIILFILNNVFIMMYCILQDIKDRKKQDKNVPVTDRQQETAHIGVTKKFYRWLNSYLYGWMRFNLIKAGKFPSYRLRKFLYKHIYRMKLSKETVIFANCEIRTPWKIHIGRSTIAGNCILDGRNGLYIEDDAVLGTGVHIWTEEHDLNDSYFRVMPKNRQPVKIERRAWICSDSTLLPGVTIHEGAVVAARACVTKDCDCYGVYAGIPAKKIATRNTDLQYVLTGRPTWHFY